MGDTVDRSPGPGPGTRILPSMRVWGIVVAGGSGSRFGGSKHVAELNGIPLWKRAADALLDCGAEGVTVVGDVPGGIPGGERRQDSVWAGIVGSPADVDIVLVHDAARALASPELVGSVIRRISVGDVDGAIPVVPVRDTLKRVDDGQVIGTVDRSELGAVQTPQGFRREALVVAHEALDAEVTDDAQALELAGMSVAVVAGEPTNLKVTYPDDLAVAVALFGASR